MSMRRSKQLERDHNLEKERGWNNTFALNRNEPRRWKQMSTDIKALVANQAPYLGTLPRTSVMPLESPSAFSSITSTFKFEHHNGTDSGLELKVLKYIMIREGLVMSLTHACEKLVKLGERGVPVNNELKSEILDGLSQIRDSTVELLEIICMWRLSSADNHPNEPIPFIWEGQNYVLKIVSDLNFMGSMQPLVELLSINPYKMVLNPLMLPNTLIEGDLWIGPEERASFDAGGLQEGDFYAQRLQLRRAERVLLQEIEVYDSQLQMGLDNNFMGTDTSQDSSMGRMPGMGQDEGFPVYGGGDGSSGSAGTRPKSEGIHGRLPHSAAPTTGGAVVGETVDMSLDEWGFSTGGTDNGDGIIFVDTGGGQGMDLTTGDTGGIVFTDANGAADLGQEFGYNPPPDYMLPASGRSNSRGGSRSRGGGQGGSRGSEGKSATSRIRGLPTQPLAPVLSPGQSPAYNETLMTRDPVDSIKVVSRDFVGLEQYNTGVPGHGRAKAHPKPGSAAAAAAGTVPPEAKKAAKVKNGKQGKKQGSSEPLSLDPMTAYDVEMVVSLATPPPQMILAAAAIVILVEEGQDYPNDVTWQSFLSMATYTDLAWEMNSLSRSMIPQFKIRAIRPFLESMSPLELSATGASNGAPAGPESDEFPPVPMTEEVEHCIIKMIIWVLNMTGCSHMARYIVPSSVPPTIVEDSGIPAKATRDPGKVPAKGTNKRGNREPNRGPSGNTNPVLDMPPANKTTKGKTKGAAKGTSGAAKKDAGPSSSTTKEKTKTTAGKTDKASRAGQSKGPAVKPLAGGAPGLATNKNTSGTGSKPKSRIPMGPPPSDPHPSEAMVPSSPSPADEPLLGRSRSADELDGYDASATRFSPRLSPAVMSPRSGENAPEEDYGDENFEIDAGTAASQYSDDFIKQPSADRVQAALAPLGTSEYESESFIQESVATGGKAHGSVAEDIASLNSVDAFLNNVKGTAPPAGSLEGSVATAPTSGEDGASEVYGDDFDGGEEIGSSIVPEDSVVEVSHSGSQVAETVGTGEDYVDDDFEA